MGSAPSMAIGMGLRRRVGAYAVVSHPLLDCHHPRQPSYLQNVTSRCLLATGTLTRSREGMANAIASRMAPRLKYTT